MTTQTTNEQINDRTNELTKQLERSKESYAELKTENDDLNAFNDAWQEENAKLLAKLRQSADLIDSLRTDHTETEERYQNEIKRLNKIIDSIQGYVGALEGGTR